MCVFVCVCVCVFVCVYMYVRVILRGRCEHVHVCFLTGEAKNPIQIGKFRLGCLDVSMNLCSFQPLVEERMTRTAIINTGFFSFECLFHVRPSNC